MCEALRIRDGQVCDAEISLRFIEAEQSLPEAAKGSITL